MNRPTIPIATLLLSTLPILFCAKKPLAGTANEIYRYDALGRLTFVVDHANGHRDYDYDAAGNRTLVSIGATSDSANVGEPTRADELPTDPNTLAPAKPRFISERGPISQYGGYETRWSVPSNTSYFRIRYRNGETVTRTPSNAFEISQYRVHWVRACNAYDCSDYLVI